MKIYTKEEIKKIKEKKCKKLKLIRRITFPFICIIIIFCLYISYQKFIKKNNDIELFGYRAYIVLTGSMEPEIDAGDIVIDKKVDVDKLKIGDIITFKLEESDATVTHRITNIIHKEGKNYFKTKGDNNNSEDDVELVYEDINGIVIFKIGKIGKFVTKVLTGTGLIFLIILVVASYEYSNIKEDRKIAREEARRRYNECKYKKDN